jgi:hypothetical protein
LRSPEPEPEPERVIDDAEKRLRRDLEFLQWQIVGKDACCLMRIEEEYQ